MNFLNGAQYRVPKHQFPNYNGYEYEDWQDCNDKNQVFPKATQFRMKPEMFYYVGATKYTNMDTALADMANKMYKGNARFTVMTEERKTDFKEELAVRNVQWTTVLSKDWVWKPMTEFHLEGYEWDVRFRVRPDHYWRVTTRNGIQSDGGSKEFHDIELLNKYITNQTSTDRIDYLSMHKVGY